MSLEQALAECTAAMKELTAAMLGRAGVVELDTRTVAQHTIDTAKTPEVRYFHNTKARTVHKVGPTDSLGGLTGNKDVLEINEAQYLECKVAYDKLTDDIVGKSAGATRTESPAPGPAAAAQTPNPFVEPSTPAPLDWDKDVLPALKKLAQKPSDSGRSLQAVLKEFEAKLVPALRASQAADGYAKLMAAIEKHGETVAA